MELMASPTPAPGLRKAASARRQTSFSPTAAAVCIAWLGMLVPFRALFTFWMKEDVEGHRRLGSDASDNAGAKIGLVLAAMLTKLSASTDDVVWLLPFVSGTHKRRNLVCYTLFMQLVVAISWGFSTGGEALLGLFVTTGGDWPLERILELTSAILLTLYALKLLREWVLERRGEAEDAKEENDEQNESKEEAAVVPTEPQTEVEAQAEDGTDVKAQDAVDQEPELEQDTQRDSGGKDVYTVRKLFTISMVGSLDDFAVFVSLILAGVLNAWQLFAGVFLGSLVVASLCLGVGAVGCVVRFVERIPLWVIISAFAVWTYVATFALH